jgi:chromosome segregation ATPase
LARNIGSKEKLIVDLTRNEREANLLTRRYEDKVRSLEEEKASKEAEAARLRSELQGLIERAARETNDRSGKSHENENDALRLAYEKKVRAAETELRALRLAKAQSDALLANTSTLVHSEADRVASDKTRELESEIAKMRADAQALRLRLREQNARDASFASSAPDATAAAELADLRREREFQSAKIEALASNETRHLEALRRATDELAAAKATIRRLGGGGENRALKDVGDAPARGRRFRETRRVFRSGQPTKGRSRAGGG